MTSKKTSAPAPPAAGPSEYERETRRLVEEILRILGELCRTLAPPEDDPLDIIDDPVEAAMREFRRGQRKRRRKAPGGK